MTAPKTHWGKLYGSLFLHPKWAATPAEGRALWTSALSYCIVIGSDGDVPESVVHMLNAPGADVATSVEQLLNSGLWVTTERGYRFHDWEEHQQTVEERKSVRAKRSEAGKASAEARRKARSETGDNTSSTSVEAPVQQTLNTLATEKRREEKRRDKKNATPDGYTDEFEAWWKVYPSNAGKDTAFKAYKARLKDHTPEDLESKLRHYLHARKLEERKGEFVPNVPHASTWLNQRRWNDYQQQSGTGVAPEWSKDECDAILGGPDYWSCPRPPEGLDLQAERDWKRARAAEHLNERRQKAMEVMNRDAAA